MERLSGDSTFPSCGIIVLVRVRRRKGQGKIARAAGGKVRKEGGRKTMEDDQKRCWEAKRKLRGHRWLLTVRKFLPARLLVWRVETESHASRTPEKTFPRDQP